MQYGNAKAVFLLTFMLFGCAKSGPEKPLSKVSNEEVINLKSGGYVKTQSYQLLETDYQVPSDTVLRVITKSNTSSVVAAKAATFVLTALFGGNTSQSTFSKHDLKGSEINAVGNPSVDYFLPNINRVIKNSLYVKNNNDYQSYPLSVRYLKFYLVYTELAGSSNYELVYTMNVSTSNPGKYKFDCSFTTGSYPLDEWSLSGYQKVKDIVKSKLDGCIIEFGKESNLRLLASDLEAMKNGKS
ncbi:Uncharacterised protein [Serratia quinivorans]|uniref:hypothetical protein n=1 Tax=Serratia quinivorans TaxID=137545 RepID=UPI002179DE37|nr:hypothetical protein [Serratia quinivorans]CAI1766498.1 Uncharacterised protein [Serratia quinivorans]